MTPRLLPLVLLLSPFACAASATAQSAQYADVPAPAATTSTSSAARPDGPAPPPNAREADAAEQHDARGAHATHDMQAVHGDHAMHDEHAMQDSHGEHAMHDMQAMNGPHAMHRAMRGALGPYPMTRESSGTAWQPDASTHDGLHVMRGDWMLMAHGVIDVVADHQSGPRGDNATFVAGMLMGMAQRDLGHGALQFRVMLSPDPLMGPRGYPLLLASGETADGVERLVDRQHPHDAFMELSASISRDVGTAGSVFAYAGLPGAPAFGPPAFMHRASIADAPEAPITHHWLDSTHISMGVLTGGVVAGRARLEVSRFNAREPDEHRWNIETGALDSTAARVSWNPTPNVALQASWGDFREPERLEPGVDQRRWSASALYARELESGARLAATLAWGRKSIRHHGRTLDDDAFAAEASLRRGAWTAFGRAEAAENRELVEDDDGHGPAYRVGKASVGAVRDVRVSPRWTAGVGGLLSVNAVPAGLASRYGGRHPVGAMLFVRVKLDGG